MGKEIVRLEHGADRSTMSGEGILTIYDWVIVDHHTARRVGVGIFQPGEDAQEGRFAASRGADQHERLDCLESQRDPVEHPVFAKRLRDTFDEEFHVVGQPGEDPPGQREQYAGFYPDVKSDSLVDRRCSPNGKFVIHSDPVFQTTKRCNYSIIEEVLPAETPPFVSQERESVTAFPPIPPVGKNRKYSIAIPIQHRKNLMKFYLAREGVAFGPYTEFQVRESVRLGIFEKNDLALAEDGREWREVFEILPGGKLGQEGQSARLPTVALIQSPPLVEDVGPCARVFGAFY